MMSLKNKVLANKIGIKETKPWWKKIFQKKKHIVVFDIGAGSSYFMKLLIKKNKRQHILGFIGEPGWRNPFIPVYNKQKSGILIDRKEIGLFRVVSTYSDFIFEDNSLDMVTVNSPHPMYPTTGIDIEVNRCLKTGGLFFYGHSMSIKEKMPDNFKLISWDDYPNYSWLKEPTLYLEKSSKEYPSGYPNVIPASKVIRNNITEHYLTTKGYGNNMGNDYVYNTLPFYANYKVWQKIGDKP
jgi:hypothetical protein